MANLSTMRSIRLSVALLGLGALAAAQQRELLVVDLHGTPFERGVQHGTRLREPIADLLKSWRVDLQKRTGLPAEQAVPRFLAATRFVEAARRHTPELLDEVRGIAQGAGQDPETMLVYQLIDELWAQAGLVRQDKCSTIGVDRDGERPCLVAQNLDVPTWMHRYPTVLRIAHGEGGLRSLVVTLPGLVAANGVNNRRVAVCVNTILQLRPTPDGLPVAFVVRGLLARESHAEALQFLHAVTHASGQAYTIGGPDVAPCFEASAGGVVPWQARQGFTWHTNHPLASQDWSPSHLAASQRRAVTPDKVPACNRYDAIAGKLPTDRRPTRDDVLAALRLDGPATPVCNEGTYVCTLFVLGTTPELHITAGDPVHAPFQLVPWQ